MSDADAPRLTPIAAILLLAFGGFVGWLFGGGAAHAPPTVLDAERVLRSEGTDFPFTLPRAGPARVAVALPPHCTAEATVTVGPLRTALRPDPVYEPDREPEHTFRVKAGDGPRRLELRGKGPYVLRIEPIPMAMGPDAEPLSAHARVTLLSR